MEAEGGGEIGGRGSGVGAEAVRGEAVGWGQMWQGTAAAALAQPKVKAGVTEATCRSTTLYSIPRKGDFFLYVIWEENLTLELSKYNIRKCWCNLAGVFTQLYHIKHPLRIAV